MKNEFPGAVPEIPVTDMNKATAYYESKLGFNIDWGGAEAGIAGISKGHCRMFLTNRDFREQLRSFRELLQQSEVRTKLSVACPSASPAKTSKQKQVTINFVNFIDSLIN
ncbi:MAG: hypothetical protein M3Q26_06790 [Acidobacteriota bacterium]|nr:hypothetical protein [Acidobacteriota bacterium]